MQTARAYRLAEASLTLWFFLTAARTVVAILLGLVSGALAEGQVNLNFVNAHLWVAGAVAVAWFAPRPRTSLPTTLALTALVVAIARVPVSIFQPTIRFYAALVVFAFGGVYIASLLRANYRTLLTALIIALTLDQLARGAGYTYDVTLRESWLLPQVGLSVAAIALSRLARVRAKHEPYQPARLTLWNGLSFGSFLFLEMALLGMPNVIARWAPVEYGPVAVWLILATALTLSPGLRKFASRPVQMFDERSRGWVWMLLLALLLVLGNRTPVAAVTLIMAQVAALMILWWIPDDKGEEEHDQVGPAVTFALAFYVVLSYVYQLIFEDANVFLPLAGQALTLHLVAAIILGVVLVGWRDPDPWHVPAPPERGLPLAFAALAVVGVVIAVRPVPAEPPPDSEVFRVATYDIHYGYGPDWRYDLEFTALSIVVAGPDVVTLQRVDTGRQVSYGVDQVLWLSRRLGMSSAYQATIEELTGDAILSRWPIEQKGGVLLASDTEQMGVAYALVRREPATRGVSVYSTRLATSADERLAQVGGLLGYVGNTDTAVVGGDLNLAVGDDTYQQLEAANLADPITAMGILEDFTYPASEPTQRRDYVFLRGLMPLESQKVCGEELPASDHCLVVIETLRP